MKMLTRRGYLVEEQGMTCLADLNAPNALRPLQAASCTYRIAFGPRAGHKVLSLQTLSPWVQRATPALQTPGVQTPGVRSRFVALSYSITPPFPPL